MMTMLSQGIVNMMIGDLSILYPIQKKKKEISLALAVTGVEMTHSLAGSN